MARPFTFSQKWARRWIVHLSFCVSLNTGRNRMRRGVQAYRRLCRSIVVHTYFSLSHMLHMDPYVRGSENPIKSKEKHDRAGSMGRYLFPGIDCPVRDKFPWGPPLPPCHPTLADIMITPDYSNPSACSVLRNCLLSSGMFERSAEYFGLPYSADVQWAVRQATDTK